MRQTDYGFLVVEGQLGDLTVLIGNKLRRLRARTGLSPEEIAPLVGATGGDEIRQYERNNGSVCLGVLETYAQAFGLPVWNIIDDEEEFDESRLSFKPKKDQDVVSCYEVESHANNSED